VGTVCRDAAGQPSAPPNGVEVLFILAKIGLKRPSPRSGERGARCSFCQNFKAIGQPHGRSLHAKGGGGQRSEVLCDQVQAACGSCGG